MTDNNSNFKTPEYVHEIEESTLSNPFSNAFKLLFQKMHLIKSDQKLIGDNKTNSRGFQTTSKDPLKATERKSLKAILRTTFNALLNDKAEKIRMKSTQNTIPKYTIGDQVKSAEQTPSVPQNTAQEFIRPLTASEKAAMRKTQTPPNIINNTVILAETAKQEKNEQPYIPDTAEIEIDESFNKDDNINITNTSKKPLTVENIIVENNVIDKQQKPQIENNPKTTDDELTM